MSIFSHDHLPHAITLTLSARGCFLGPHHFRRLALDKMLPLSIIPEKQHVLSVYALALESCILFTLHNSVLNEQDAHRLGCGDATSFSDFGCRDETLSIALRVM